MAVFVFGEVEVYHSCSKLSIYVKIDTEKESKQFLSLQSNVKKPITLDFHPKIKT